MPTTYRELAETLGVSKPTVIARCNELDPDSEHRVTEGRTVRVDDWLASAVSNRQGVQGVRAKAETQHAADPPESIIEAITAGYEARLALQEARIADLQATVGRLERDLDAARDDLRESRAETAAARADLDRQGVELAKSRALEGWHWPWERRAIEARYALPAPESQNQK